MIKGNLGFISTRFASNDGVTLESYKWAEVLKTLNLHSFWYAGLIDQDPEISMCVPEAFFGHEENAWINRRIWGCTRRDPVVTDRIMVMANYLKSTLYQFIRRYDIEVLIIQNAVTIPMHVPLGVAISQLLAETGMPAIAHHHDFYWERDRFSVNAIADFIDMAFPPRHRRLQHVVINEAARESLALRKGVTSILIPNVLDFENPPAPVDAYTADLRADLGLASDDVFILQPTRIVPRKGIEHAIKLVQMLGDPKYKLVITHEAGDEGMEYMNMLSDLARESGVDLRFISTRVGETRQIDDQGRKMYTLNDIYPHADFVTYPSLYEGFGNAFLEAVYHRVPMLVNRYGVFGRDIEPKGFRVAVMDGFITRKVVAEIKRILERPSYKTAITDHNYHVAIRYYSYSVLRRSLRTLITNITGLTEQ
jgi:mannosylglucosylglycerate synthase